MKKMFLAPMLLMSLSSPAQHALHLLPYPKPVQQEVSDTYFGKVVKDPYRWLEDDHSAETAAWVEAENRVTRDYLMQIPFRDKVNKELSLMWNYEKFSGAFKEGNYYLYYRNDGLQNQSVLYIQNGKDGKPEEFINPNTLNAAGTSALGSVSFSKTQKYCAYSVSDAGSDWQKICILQTEPRKLLKEEIQYSKFSGISWKGDEGFYYSGYDRPSEKDQFSAKTEFQKIFFHKIGTSQSADVLIYEDKQNPLIYKGAALSEDQRWLMLNLAQGTDGTELQFMDLKDKNQKKFKVLCPGFSNNYDFVTNIDGRFLIYTNFEAPNYRLVWMDPAHPEPEHWKDFLPEASQKLDAVHRVGDRIFCSYLINANTQVNVYDLNGTVLSTIELPALGTASGFEGSEKDDITFYTFTSFNQPPVLYEYDLKSGRSTVFKSPSLKTDFNNTVVEQLWFTSRDGTRVPMFVYHRADVDLKKGPHPVLLYGYGGFNISLTPSFSIPMSYFVQKGGIYVSVSLRGGSEFGEKWHEAGMLDRKQNVFDDFIGAAEFLIKEGITRSDMLAIHGRSNGGLLVGACMTQRPDLFKVCLPGVGVLDMLRFHKFTVGWGWVVEYGSSDKESDFKFLYSYSPLHQLKKGTSYPATLITTADHDDRVVPAHSFKFAATLQEVQNGKEPVLIRIDTQAGHGAGKPVSKQIDEWTDILSFTMYHLGMDGFK